jgi:acetyl esterase/lipase
MLAHEVDSGIQENIACRDIQIPTQDGQLIPARVYRPKSLPEDVLLPVYLFFHGGGFLFGTLSSEDANCERIVATLNIIVVNVCYRHTPQFKHPTQANDAWDAFKWVCDHFDAIGGDKDQLVVGGVSAGGSLAASVVLKENKTLTGRGRIKGQVLCIPQLFHPDALPFHLLASEDISSYHQHVNAPIIPRTQLDLFKSILDVEDPSDTSLFVGSCAERDVVGMPKTAFFVAGLDPLRDEALLYAEKLKRNK